MFCSKCGNQIKEGELSCSICGTPVTPIVTPVQPVQPVEPVQPVVQQQPIQPVQPMVQPIQQPVQQPVQPMVQPIQQPVQPMNYNSTGKKKINSTTIIMVVLAIVILGLLFYIIKVKNNEKDVNVVHNGIRTIMIYASPTNLESQVAAFTYDTQNLDPEEVDLDHVNVIVYTGGTTQWYNFVEADENAIYKLTKDGFEKLESYDQKNMSDEKTLTEFLTYVYDNFESEYYDLMFYDHGGALTGAIADDFNKNDMLELNEIGGALKNSPFGKVKLEMIMFRTCIMGTLEVAKVVESYANYLVASEDSIMLGAKNDCLSFIERITPESTTLDVANGFVEDYTKFHKKYGFKDVVLSYGVIDLSKVGTLFDEYAKFMDGIDYDKDYNKIAKIRKGLYSYGDVYDMVDLKTFVNKISSYSSYDSSKVIDALDAAVVSVSTEKSVNNGLSVYFPSNVDNAKKLFLNIYKNSDLNDSYYKSLKSYTSAMTGKTSSALTTAGISLAEQKVTDSKEFTLQLTDEQVAEYASSRYVVLKKIDGDYYMPVYTADDATIDDNNVLTTNISNRIIRIANAYDKNGNYMADSYVTAFGYDIKSGEGYYELSGVVNNWDADVEIGNWKTAAIGLQLVEENGKPVVKTFTKKETDEETGVSTYVAFDPSDFKSIELYSSSYKLMDFKGGQYLDTSKSNPTLYGFSEDLDKLEFEFTSLEGSGEYYCIFLVSDIYGGGFATNAIKLT